MANLDMELGSDIRFFAFRLANGSVSQEIFDEPSYSDFLKDPKVLQQCFAIWANIARREYETDDAYDGYKRVGHYLLTLLDPEYRVEPPFEDWELELTITDDVWGKIHWFAYDLANGSLDRDIIDTTEYIDHTGMFIYGYPLEQIFALWSNVLEIDENNKVTNEVAAKRRVAQYLRRWIDRDYVVEPPFENWETELH